MKKTIIPALIIAPVLLLGVTTSSHTVSSLASWNNQEYVTASTASPKIGTATCEVISTTSHASSRIVSGNLIGIDLSDIAEIDGVSTHNIGGAITVSPSSSQLVIPPDGWANPLSVTALQAINADLTGLLQFPEIASTGAYNQFAQAQNLAQSKAATGAVTNQGAIDLSLMNNPQGPPQFATIQLGSLLEATTGQALSELVTDVTDVLVHIGAVASYAHIDGCASMWLHDVYEFLERQYLTSSVDAQIVSPLVADLGNTVETILTTLDNTLVNELTFGLQSATGPLLTFLGNVLGSLPGIQIGVPVISNLTLQVDLSEVTSLVSDPLILGNSLGSIDLMTGTITVDLTQLLGPSYQNSVGLNGLAANTQLLLNEDALGHLLDEVLATLNLWQTDVLEAIENAYDAVKVRVNIRVPLKLRVLGLNLVDVDLNISVNSIDNPSNPVAVTVNCFLVCGLVSNLLNLVDVIAAGVLPAIIDQITLLVAVTLGTLTQDLTMLIGSAGLSGTVLGMLNDSLSTLFDENAIISWIVNAQNAPDPASVSTPAGIEPNWASSLAAPNREPDNSYHSGEWAVSALRLVTLGAVAHGIGLDFAYSLIGPNTVEQSPTH